MSRGAGSLRTRVRLERAVESRDAAGGVSQAWELLPHGEVWASVTPLTGQELVNARQIDSTITHEVRIRFRDDVTSDHRIVTAQGGRVLNIKSTLNDEYRDTMLRLMCVEGTGGTEAGSGL